MTRTDFNKLMLKVKKNFYTNKGYICWAFEREGVYMATSDMILGKFFVQYSDSSTGIFGTSSSKENGETRKIALEMFHQVSLMEGYYKDYDFKEVV